jgi:hypothetical protein
VLRGILWGPLSLELDRVFGTLLALVHAGFHQQHVGFILGLHYLPDRQVAITQRKPPLLYGDGGPVASVENRRQAVANLVGVDAVVFLFSPPLWAVSISGCAALGAAACGSR